MSGETFNHIIKSMESHRLIALREFCMPRNRDNSVVINAINNELRERNEKNN